MKVNTLIILIYSIFFSNIVFAGIVNPDCTMKDGIKSVTSKAVVGVGGRCTPIESISDTTSDVIDNKTPDNHVTNKVVEMTKPEPKPVKSLKKSVIN